MEFKVKDNICETEHKVLKSSTIICTHDASILITDIDNTCDIVENEDNFYDSRVPQNLTIHVKTCDVAATSFQFERQTIVHSSERNHPVLNIVMHDNDTTYEFEAEFMGVYGSYTVFGVITRNEYSFTVNLNIVQ